MSLIIDPSNGLRKFDKRELENFRNFWFEKSYRSSKIGRSDGKDERK